MARIPKEPRYFKSRGAYFVQLSGRQILLAKGPQDDAEVRKEAWLKFRGLMASYGLGTEMDKGQVFGLLNTYLLWVRDNLSGKTFLIKSSHLQSFSDTWGKVTIQDLRIHHVETWLEKNPSWGTSSRRIALSCVASCFSWGKKRGFITQNPFDGMKLPSPVSRGTMSVITRDQHEAFLKYAWRRARKDFYWYLMCLYETGARPGEVLGIEAKHYRKQLKAWVIEAGKGQEGRNKLAHRGFRRIIHLTPAIIPSIEALNRATPSGPIFRNDHGKPLTLADVCGRFKTVRELFPDVFGEEITSYSYRHNFATTWLLKGKPIGILAELLGTSIQMIQKHYSHITERTDILQASLVGFRTEVEGPVQ